jgi:predicted nucleic acid-binding protein
MIRLNEALAGVTALGFDTSPFIYYIERHPRFLDVKREVIRRVDAGNMRGYTSVVTLVEVLTQPKRLGNTIIEREYRNLLLHSRHFELISIDATIAEHASRLRSSYGLRTPDALQIAAALHLGCQGFLTNDPTLKRVADLKVLVLDELEL